MKRTLKSYFSRVDNNNLSAYSNSTSENNHTLELIEDLSNLLPPIIFDRDILFADSLVLVKALTIYYIKKQVKNINEIEILQNIKHLKSKLSSDVLQLQSHTVHICNAGSNGYATRCLLQSLLPSFKSYTAEDKYVYNSGLLEINKLFHFNGFPSGQIIELLGLESSGKTQICISTAISSAMDGANVLLIDTCNGITMKRIIAMTTDRVNQYCQREAMINNNIMNNDNVTSSLGMRLKAKFTDVMSRIHISNVFDIFNLMNLLSEVKDNNNNNRYNMIIIDGLESVIFPLVDYSYCESGVMRTVLSPGTGTGTHTHVEKIDSLLCNLILLCKAIVNDDTANQSSIIITTLSNTSRINILTSAATNKCIPISYHRVISNHCLDELFDISLYISREHLTHDHTDHYFYLDVTNIEKQSHAQVPTAAILIDVLVRPYIFAHCPNQAKVNFDSFCKG